MSYFLFFYNYVLVLATALALVGFGVLYVRQRRRLYLYVSFLFALYLIDITLLWMTESIPEFNVAMGDFQNTRPYFYTLFSTIILLAYRLIIGDLLDYPVSNHEAALWLLCLVGIIGEWQVRDDLYRFTVDLVFPLVLRIWIVLVGVFMYVRQRGIVEQSRSRIALGMLAVIFVMESIDTLSPSPGARSVPLEIMGFIFTSYGLTYLASRVRIAREQADRLQTLRLAQLHNLTRREEELLKLLLEHKTNREIGEELTISIGTVKTHVHHIYEKVGVRSREELYQAAVEAQREAI